MAIYINMWGVSCVYVNDIKKEKKNNYLSFPAIVKTKAKDCCIKGEFKFKWTWLFYKGIIEFSLIYCKSSYRNTKK